MIPLLVPVIGLGITNAASVAANVFQAMQNKKLRQQIEQLTAIIKNQQNEISELKKQMQACKIWAFKQKREYSRQIKELEQELAANKQQLSKLEKSAA